MELVNAKPTAHNQTSSHDHLHTHLQTQLLTKETVDQKKMPVMCIGEYCDVTPFGQHKVQVNMVPFLYYPEIDCFYIDLPIDYDKWEGTHKKEYFVRTLNLNSDYLAYSERKENPYQLGSLILRCHQGKLIQTLIKLHGSSFIETQRRFRSLTKKYLYKHWDQKSLVIPSKSIFIDQKADGKLKIIIYETTLRDYTSLRSVEDFLLHRINILHPKVNIELTVAILLGAIWELKLTTEALDLFQEVAHGPVSPAEDSELWEDTEKEPYQTKGLICHRYRLTTGVETE